ncbi:MAG: ATP-dependent Clp protease ATP-binding subunit ClpX, partial [bacterium]
EDALIKILTQPKNSIVKQYQKLLSFDNVRLHFSEGALRAIARKAIERKTGARGLRAILEEVMLDVMYEIPSQKGVKECIVSEETILKHETPLLVYETRAESA